MLIGVEKGVTDKLVGQLRRIEKQVNKCRREMVAGLRYLNISIVIAVSVERTGFPKKKKAMVF